MMTRIITKSGTTISQVLSSNNPLLLSSGSSYILVDTGRKAKRDCIIGEIIKQLNGCPLSALILTHAHHDHVENAAAIKEHFGAKVVIHESEASIIARGENGGRFFEPVQADIPVGEALDLSDFGFNACALWTPGHTCGSLSIVFINEIALVGDALGCIVRRPEARGFTAVSAEMIQTWKMLLQLECRQYIPAHGSTVSYIEFSSRFKAYMGKDS